MKLIIDIPEEVYKKTQKTVNCGMSYMDFYCIVQNGAPISDNSEVCDIGQIRKEIQYEADNIADITEMKAYYRVLQIIDKYKAESEDKEQQCTKSK